MFLLEGVRCFSLLHPDIGKWTANTSGVFLHTKLACSFKRSQQSVKGVNVLLWPQRIVIIITLETVARPQMSNGYGGMDPSWQARWQTVLNQPFSPTGCVTPRAQAHTRFYSHAHTLGPSKVMVCVQWQAGRVLSCLAAITILLL